MDKRTARREYRSDFSAGIVRYRQRLGYAPPLTSRKASAYDDDCAAAWSSSEKGVRVVVRKRPIFQHEIENGEFDVVTCLNNNKLIVHDARMHNDMKRQMMNHHEFDFDKVFHEKAANEEVYQSAAKPLVDIAVKGGYATALVYGQTGSGKTFTMSSIYAAAVRDIFEFLHVNVDRFSSAPIVSVSFIEIAGDHVHDLLNGFSACQLASGADGAFHPFPVVEPVVSNADELLALIQHAINIRPTAATGVHDASSRSHAMLRIYIQRPDLSGEEVCEGVLTLVDLAGSEHRIDSMYHGKERRKETSYINASLMALKDCLRVVNQAQAKAALDANNPNPSGNTSTKAAPNMSHIYRKSKLTMALKNSFTLPKAQTMVICCVSPASKDTEHSLNTLRHACLMLPQDDSKDASQEPKETRFITGGSVLSEQIGEVNLTNLARKNQMIKKQQGTIDGPKTSNGNTLDNKQSKQANKEEEITDKMRAKMRRMAEQKSFATLDPAVKTILKTFRARVGREPRQIVRMRNGRPLDAIAGEEEVIDENLMRDTRLSNPAEEVDDEEMDYDDNLLLELERQQEEEEELVEDDHLDWGRPDSANSSNHHHSRRRHHTPNKKHHHSPAKHAHSNHSSGHNATRKLDVYHDDFEPEDSKPASLQSRSRPSSAQRGVVQQLSPKTALKSSSGLSSRISFDAIYDSIFIAKDEVPDAILFKQLRAMLRLHGYRDDEVDTLIKNKNQHVTNAAGGDASSSNRRPLSAQRSRPLAPSSSSSSIHQTASQQAATPQGGVIKGAVIRRSAIPTNKMPPPPQQQAQPQQQQTSIEVLAQLEQARLKVDQEAALRKQRQEAARAYRDEQDRVKAEKLRHRHITPNKLPATAADNYEGFGGYDDDNNVCSPPIGTDRDDVVSTSSKQSVNRNQITLPAEKLMSEDERNMHLDEVQKLTSQLSTDTDLTIAKKFAIKKQLAAHKAAILRAERAKLTLMNGGSAITAAPAPNNDRNSHKRREAERPKSQQFDEEEGPRSVGRSQLVHEGKVLAPTVVAEEPVYMVSASGRPLSTRMAQNLLEKGGNGRHTDVASSNGSGKVIGYHVEERSSYDSDAFSRAVQQPVGIRSDNHLYPPQRR